MAVQPARGTRDIYGVEGQAFQFVEEAAKKVAETYGFTEIRTPIFEFADVFSRGLGDATDVVSKEMYVFEDRGGEKLTLRPEGTAGVVRSFISEGMEQNLPVKLFYNGPMFRYERPQKGRFRQFHQIGAELFGPTVPEADIEILAMAWDILTALGIKDLVRLELNTLGDAESRQSYRDALVAYFSAYKNDLSDDSRARLEKNPLRILDSKDEKDKRLLEGAPKMTDYLTDASRAFFDAVCKGLDALSLPYVVNPRLVRGLDYYRHTVFEFITDSLGAQGTVLGGGRYDGLVSELGGPAVSGVGFASGVDRVAMLVRKQNLLPAAVRPLALVPVGAEMTLPMMKIAHDLRTKGFVVDMSYSGNMSKRMKKANKINAIAALMMGSDEYQAGSVTVRHLDSGDQKLVAISDLAAHLKSEGF